MKPVKLVLLVTAVAILMANFSQLQPNAQFNLTPQYDANSLTRGNHCPTETNTRTTTCNSTYLNYQNQHDLIHCLLTMSLILIGLIFFLFSLVKLNPPIEEIDKPPIPHTA